MAKQLKAWVLYDQYAQKYLQTWAGSGPSCTPYLDSAHVFDTEMQAQAHPAYRSWFSSFRAIEVWAEEVEG